MAKAILPKVSPKVKSKSASGWTQWARTTSAERADIRRRAEGIPLQTGIRCNLCGRYVEHTYPARRADGLYVPACYDCSHQAA